MHLRFIVTVTLVALACSAPARAEIVNAGPSGFNVRQVAEVPTPAPRVGRPDRHQQVVGSRAHVFRRRAQSLLDPTVRGCFCEKLGLYAGIEHARVIYAQPAKTLRFRAAHSVRCRSSV